MSLYKRASSSVLSARALCLVLVVSLLFHEANGVGIVKANQHVISRKLITSISAQGTVMHESSGTQIARMGLDSCSKDDIVVYQGATAPLPNGIPTYSVQVLNTCTSGCSMSNIHLSCGWFSSARLVDPSLFRRLKFDDCLVNDGGPLGPGKSLSFEYANTYPYKLVVSSVECI